jgi:flagellar motor switch/type III secretory pathway protein FliN
LAGEPVNLTVAGKIVAEGEVVVIGSSFGIKITQIFHKDLASAVGG